MVGNEFTQQIFGNEGQNFITGKGGADFLWGFGGDDRFVFDTALGGGNIDTINDFSTGHDQIWMDNAVFTGLSDGLLATGAFFIGAAAHDADDRIIYNNLTGALLYDVDGNGAGAAVQFATLQTGLTPVATDFFVL
jgi:serralysin